MRASETISQRSIECNNYWWVRMLEDTLPTLREWGLWEVRAKSKYN